jgi:flagellar biosynthesis protein FlhF
MDALKIVADSPQEALERIHAKLGPNAVVLNVRQLPVEGVKKLWSNTRVEVTASTPEPEPDSKATIDRLNAKIAQLEEQVLQRSEQPPEPKKPLKQQLPSKVAEMVQTAQQAVWEGTDSDGMLPAVKILERLGLLPSHARWLSGQARNFLGFTKPRNLQEEFGLVRETLSDYWHQLIRRHTKPGNPARLFVGTPGTGKTTCLCKWMTQAVLRQGQDVHTWRLDGSAPNTAEFLSVHGEVLQAPVERTWDQEAEIPKDTLRLVDLPGISAGDREARRALVEQVKGFPLTEIYLVLNASYDLGLLLSHARFFSVLPLSGLILTHLDEETRWSKYWNLVLATQLPILYLSGGQNIPGDFRPALPDEMFDQFVEAGREQMESH